ncbi:RNA polymerase sigma factor [Gordonia phage Anon]|nr:RNA polymerase sigma factor [Gordonia phage Anon]
MSALIAWGRTDGHEDLVQDLHVWYLESPGTQAKLAEADRELAITLVRRAALQMLAKKSLADDTFNGRNNYSSDSVKDALKGVSKNRYLVDILPIALRELEEQNEGQAEAIRVRYTDGGRPDKDVLSRAVRSLTEHVNLIVFNAGVDADGKNTEGPGSRHAVFAETRKGSNSDHSDPTADMAIALIEHGDDPIELENDQTTTLRKEFMNA